MNGSNGIVPTIDLATNNAAYPYPVMYGGNSGFGGFGNDGALWLIVLLALIWGNNGGNGGFGFGNGGFDNGYAWLSNGQKEIMQNTNNGFDTLHLSNQVEGIRNGVSDIQNAICNSTASVTSAINTTAYNAEIAAANRQMANMNTAFDLSRQFADCCCENRLGIAGLGSDIAREACATRTSDTQNTQAILNAINNGIVSIKQQLCDDKIDEKNEKITDLQREILMKDLQASQLAQTVDTVNSVYSRLKDCPVGTVPVYGNQSIFSCPINNSGSCGCSGNYVGTFI